jgi:hypothetical protein
MAPLERVKERTVVFGGLWSKSAEPPEGITGFDHWVAVAFLTAYKPKKTTGSDATVWSPTIDQVIANKIGQDSTLPSLQLAVEDPGSNSSSCGEGYACSYTNSISWVGTYDKENKLVGTKPLPMELNPQVVFERLFGSGATPEVRAARRSQGKSILDAFVQSLGGMKKSVGATDRNTLEQYTEEVREIERRLDLAAKASEAAPDMNEPNGIPQTFDDHIKMHYDLVALAFKADITRVATLLGARDLTGKTYPFPKGEWFPNGGNSVSFHGGSHHADVPASIANYAQLNRYHVMTTAYLAEAEGHSGRRRHVARSRLDPARDQHGQFESASAFRRAAHSHRRRERKAERRPLPQLREKDGQNRKSAVECSRYVRHSSGYAGRQ